jgi:4'-phosphopantetheinyl transferase
VEVYWLAANECDVPPDDSWLSAREAAVAAGLRVPKRRADWRLGRWTAKCAIAGYSRLPAEALPAIELWPAPSGAPQALIGAHPADLAISLSHSCGTGFCTIAAAGAELGCDVERVAPHGPAFLADYFTPEEREFVDRSAAPDRIMLATLLWSAKESALKALQRGLRADTRSVVAMPCGVPVNAGAEWRRLAAAETGGRIFQGWWRQTGDFVWTILAAPEPASPLALSLPAVTERHESAAIAARAASVPKT